MNPDDHSIFDNNNENTDEDNEKELYKENPEVVALITKLSKWCLECIKGIEPETKEQLGPNSINQKSVVGNLNKINLQALIFYEENKSDYSYRILSDHIDFDNNSLQEKIGKLLKQMENYKDNMLEYSLCRTPENILILDMFRLLSKEAMSLYDNSDKKMQNYFKTLKDVKYPTDLIDDLININHKYVFIDDIANREEEENNKQHDTINLNEPFEGDFEKEELKETLKKPQEQDHDYDYDFEYDNDKNSLDSSSSDNNGKSSFLNKKKDFDNDDNDDSDDKEYELTEVNGFEQNKLIFVDEFRRKEKQNKIRPKLGYESIDSITFYPNKNRELIDELRAKANRALIDVINTDRCYLPTYDKKYKINELLKEIKRNDNHKDDELKLEKFI